MKQTNGRADDELARTIVDNIGRTVEWLTERWVDWNMEPLNVGYTVSRTWFDSEELVDTLVAAAEDDGATFHYRTEAGELVFEDGEVMGLKARTDDSIVEFRADAVVVAAGGYESSEEQRTKYYGSDYDAMKVRGSRYNTGEGVEMVLDAGGRATGQWGGAHMALIDAESANYEGGANRVDGYQYGVLLNNDGERFFDEGEDARAHTYAKLGRLIFEGPGHEAFIVIDEPLKEHMRATGPGNWVEGDTVAEVLAELGCNEREEGTATIEEFNAACAPTSSIPIRWTATVPRGSTSRSPTGCYRSTSRRSTAIASPVASPSASAALHRTLALAHSTRSVAPSPASTSPATPPAGCSSTTTPAALASPTPPSSGRSRPKKPRTTSRERDG